MPRLHYGAATERPETTNSILPPIPKVVWLQPQATHSTNIQKSSITETHKNIHKPESKQRNDVESKRSPMKKTSSQVSVSSTELFRGNQTGSKTVQSLNNSRETQSEIQRQQMNMTANANGYDNISPPKIKNSQKEEQLPKDDRTNELMPLSTTTVLKRQKERL